MTTYVAHGVFGVEDPSDHTNVLSVKMTDLEIIVPDSVKSFSYEVDGFDEEGLPQALVDVDGYAFRLDGVAFNPYANRYSADIQAVKFGNKKTAYAMQIYDSKESEFFIFQLAGDPLPTFSSAKSFEKFVADINLKAIPSGTGFGPGDEITFKSLLKQDSFSKSENDEFVGTNGKDVYNTGAGNDRVAGRGGNDQINGGAGRDQIAGDGGRDKLNGQGGKDKVDGGAGNDILLGQAGNDQIRGGAGKDYIDGGKDNDRIIGDGGNDEIIGGLGNDILYGGTGDDLLFGNAGNDKFGFESDEAGDDTIGDFNAAEDKIRIHFGAAEAQEVEVTNDGTDTVITIAAGGPDQITLVGVTATDIDNADFIF